MKYGYYTGCGITASEQEHEFSLKGVLELLRLDVRDIEAPGCVSGMIGGMDEDMVTARELLIDRVREACADIDTLIVPCPGCYRGFRSLQESSGFPRILHPLELLTDDVCRETMKSMRTRRLGDLKITPYYGCIFKPCAEGEFGRHRPKYMEDVFEALGLETVWFPEFDECCGGPQLMDQPEKWEPVSRRIIDSAESWDVDVISVACSQCHSVLEGSARSDRIVGRDGVLVIYYSQIVGLLMGLDKDSLFLSPDDDSLRDASPGSLI